LRRESVLVLMALALAASACSDSTPTAPQPFPSSGQWETWTLTERLTSSSTPSFECQGFAQGAAVVGRTWTREIFVLHEGSKLLIDEYGDNPLSGSIRGTAFAVQGRNWYEGCENAATDQISGSFLAGGSRLEAVKIMSFRHSGEDVRYTFEWTASRE